MNVRRRLVVLFSFFVTIFSLGLGAAGATQPLPAQTANRTATINVRTSLTTKDLLIVVKTVGGPPTGTAAAVELVNDEGTNAVTATVLDNQADPRCTDGSLKTRYGATGPEPGSSVQRWCIRVGVPEPGSQVVGVLIGSQTTLTLNVMHQAAWGWPLVVTVVGLALAFGLVWISRPRSSSPPTTAPLAEKGGSLWGEVKLLGGLLGVFGPMLVAGATIFVGTYVTNKTFGTDSDLWTLFLASAGTSAATGAVAALLLRRRRTV